MTQQLSLWEEQEVQAPVHHFMELHYYGGERRVIDTANPDDDDTRRDRNVFLAGFVSAEAALQLPAKPSTHASARREVAKARLTFGDPASMQRALAPEPLTDEELQEMAECGA